MYHTTIMHICQKNYCFQKIGTKLLLKYDTKYSDNLLTFLLDIVKWKYIMRETGDVTWCVKSKEPIDTITDKALHRSLGDSVFEGW